METFTLDWGRSWWARLLGRNQLVRTSDRLETLAVALAVIALIVAVPVAATIGTSAKEARSAVYAQQALSRHQTTATALENATMHSQMYTRTFEVRAGWAANGSIHVATISTPAMVRAGGQTQIWIDDSGNYSAAPSPPSKAATEAVGWAALLWFAVAGALAVAVYGLHRMLNRTRYSDWDRDLDSLAGNDGGRASH
jgi:hypothetical protein